MGWFKWGLVLVYVLIGLYFVDTSLGFYPIPDAVEDFNDLILLIGGILIIFHGLIFLKPRRRLKVS